MEEPRPAKRTSNSLAMSGVPTPIAMDEWSSWWPILTMLGSMVLGLVMLGIVLAIQYPKQAIFTRKRKDVPLVKDGLPIFGNLYQGLEHRGRRLDRELELVKEYGIVRRITAWPIFRKSVDVIITEHPLDVSHCMSDPYLYIKDAKVWGIQPPLERGSPNTFIQRSMIRSGNCSGTASLLAMGWYWVAGGFTGRAV